MIEMPNPPPELLIFEPFIDTDDIIVSSKSINENGHHLMWNGQSRWVEITVGVIGKQGLMHSLSPSITVKESGDILSLEEKFQGKIFVVVILCSIVQVMLSKLPADISLIINYLRGRWNWHQSYSTSVIDH